MGKASRRKKEAEDAGRKIPITPEMQELLTAQRKAFVEEFGREPGPGDPIFFDPSADIPERIDEHEVEQQTVEIMRAAGIDPAKIHAFQKTGRILTPENMKYLTEEDIAEWQDAVDEYRAINPSSRAN